jgi:glycyl-tRNA synthetase (class II)
VEIIKIIPLGMTIDYDALKNATVTIRVALLGLQIEIQEQEHRGSSS